jgi:hypothetical protein
VFKKIEFVFWNRRTTVGTLSDCARGLCRRDVYEKKKDKKKKERNVPTPSGRMRGKPGARSDAGILTA